MSAEIESPVPKYLQVARVLRDRITKGELRPGDEVPSERVLAEQLGIARYTANRALNILRAEGLVESEQGRGTFVLTPPKLVRRAHNRYSLARATGNNLTPGQRNEIIAAGPMAAPATVAAILDLEEGAEVIGRRRLVHRVGEDSDPVELSTSYFRHELADGTAIAELPNISQGMMAYVEQLTGRRYTAAVDQVAARQATEDEIHLLRLGEDRRCVLVVNHTAYDAQGEPLEVVQSIHPAGSWILEDDYSIDR